MKSIAALFLAVLLLLGGLIPQNDLSELGKLPELLEHYQYHHQAAGGGLSLSAFLVLHYSPTTTHYQHAYSAKHSLEHQKLPLHNHHNCVPVAFVLPIARPLVPMRLTQSIAVLRSVGLPLYACSFSWSLLQPPRAPGFLVV